MRTVGKGALSSIVVSLVLVATAFAADTFTDDDGNIHESAIEAIAAEGITKGCNPPLNDEFCPAGNVTRQEMAAFLVRANDLPGSDDNAFTDDDGSVFEADINALAASGITKGCNPPSNNLFCPTTLVTRGQMAAFLVRAFDLDDPGPGNWFVDDDDSIFEAEIDKLAEAGITKGCNPPANTNYCPDNPVRRDEMATFLARALGLTLLPPPPPPDDDDPEWYTTPEIVGTGVRTIVVTPGGVPGLETALGDAKPGDTILLAPGTHTGSGNIVATVSGTSAAWIEIKAQSGLPIIDLQAAGEFRIEGSYVLFEGVELINGGGNNLHIAPGSADVHHVIARDLVIRDLAWGPGAAIKINRNNGAGAGVSQIYLENNDLTDAISNAVIDGVGVNQAVVRGNDIHDNAVGSHGVFFKGGSSEVLIEANLIRGIRQNAALQLGGNTGSGFFDPAFSEWEGVDQVARNNLIADFDDSAVEIRGVLRGEVYHNTIVTQSTFAIFRLSSGNTDSGGVSGNDVITITNNLVVATGGDPQYARNDGGAAGVTFGTQLWAGTLHNSGSQTPNIPIFPQPNDVVADPSATLVDPSDAVAGWADGLSMYELAAGSPAFQAGDASTPVSKDIVGLQRSATPSIGAFEGL